MNIIEVIQAESKPNPHGVDARTLSDSINAQVVHITLKPGQSLKKHITPVDAIFYVLEGEGILQIGDERNVIGADTLVESPAKVPHSWSNESNSKLRILVIKTPRPTEPTKFL